MDHLTTTDTMIVKISNRPGKFFRVNMEDDDYRVRLYYADTTYNEDLASGNLRQDCLTIHVDNKRPNMPELKIIPCGYQGVPYFGLDLAATGWLKEEAIDAYAEGMLKAKQMIAFVKEQIRTYFPGILI